MRQRCLDVCAYACYACMTLDCIYVHILLYCERATVGNGTHVCCPADTRPQQECGRGPPGQRSANGEACKECGACRTSLPLMHCSHCRLEKADECRSGLSHEEACLLDYDHEHHAFPFEAGCQIMH